MKLDTINPEAIREGEKGAEEQTSLSDSLLEAVVGGVAAQQLALGCCRYKYKVATATLAEVP